MIIALAGMKRVGKDTIADYIAAKHKFAKCSLSWHLKATLRTLFGWGFEHTDGDLKDQIDPAFGVSPRQMMLFFGTDVMQFHVPAQFQMFEQIMGRKFWCQRLWEDTKDVDDYVISDMRFPHEAEFFREMNESTLIIRVTRPNCHGDNHPSETGVELVLPDYIIRNNGTLEDLYKEIEKVMNDICTKIEKGELF